MSSIKDTKVYSINDFLNWYDNGELVLSPKYQRNSVWNEKQKSYLIDTILRGFPIPQVFLRQEIDLMTRKTTREIIDGQQRLRSIIEFNQDLFPISKSHSKELGGKYFSDLDGNYKESFLEYNISTELIKIKDVSKIYEMFARLNTNNVVLNRQELRNATFWGEFKVFVYKKTSDYRNFLIDFKVFNDKDLARMNEVELVNSLVLNCFKGIISETPSLIDKMYKDYNNEFLEQDDVDDKFNRIMDVIISIFDHPMFETKFFHRKTYLYTLFSVINQQLYGGLGDQYERYEIFSIELIKENISILINRLMAFESILENVNDMNVNEMENNYDEIKDFQLFLNNHKSRTTNSKERSERINILIEHLKPNIKNG